MRRQTPMGPEAAVARLTEHAARGRVALVLGGERRGLSDEDLSRCHDVLVIDTDEAQPSMNLSHAAAVLLYECSRSRAPAAPQPPGAELGFVHKLEALMKETLLAAEFVYPEGPQHALMELSRSLVRGGLSARDAQLWYSAFVHLRRSLKR